MNVGYSKTFPHPSTGQWEKIWAEEENFTGTIEEARKVWYAIKREVENFHYESNKAAEKQMGMSIKNIYPKEFGVPPLYENEPIEGKKLDDEILYKLNTNYQEYDLKEQIKSCNEIKVLESYKFIVKGKPELEQVYNNRLKELT